MVNNQAYSPSCEDHVAGLFCEQPASNNLSFDEGRVPPALGLSPRMIFADVQARLETEGFCFMREIPLTQGYVAIVDDEDFERFGGLRWHIIKCHSNKFYAGHKRSRTIGNGTLLLHRAILDAPPSKEVDHKNGDGLDCQRHNLRLASRDDNMHNSRIPNTNTSGFKGVCWDKARGKWHVGIKLNRKLIFVGRYSDLKKAAKAYDAKARELFGEFARLNFPDDDADAVQG